LGLLDLLDRQRVQDGNNDGSSGHPPPPKQQPDDLWSRKAAIHMYLGQLPTGMEALAAYQKGVDCLLQAQAAARQQHDYSSAAVSPATAAATSATSMINSEDDDNDANNDDDDNDDDDNDETTTTLPQQLAAAYTSMADLCFADSAESLCEQHLQRALQCDRHSVDALQTLEC
jgi:hypothetical protein